MAQPSAMAPRMLSPERADLAATPRLYPHALDTLFDRVVLVERTEEDFRSAAFLDDRSLQAGARREIVAWQDVAAAMPRSARRDVQYIFHIGHVGSTLISRLLGELPALLALREPLLLRTFADQIRLAGRPECAWPPHSLQPRIETLTALLSRTFRSGQRAIVKATSFTSEAAPALVPHGSRALLVYTSAQRYLENILAGDASRQELHMLAGSRVARLNARHGEPRWNLWELAEAEKAALAWACEMTSLQQAERALGPDRTLWVDFDAFLADPATALARVAAFFGEPIDAATAGRLAASPLMQRYSKSLEHEYSPGLREEVLAESRSANRAAIGSAMGWLNTAAQCYPALADCLARSSQD